MKDFAIFTETSELWGSGPCAMTQTVGSVEGVGEANRTLSPTRHRGPIRAPLGAPVPGTRRQGPYLEMSVRKVDRATGG